MTGVDKRSVDTWMHPNIFHMQFSTGAPPDYFDANGQNWGFPTYNWEEMAKDGYEWWRRRLTTLSQCGPASSLTTQSTFHVLCLLHAYQGMQHHAKRTFASSS